MWAHHDAYPAGAPVEVEPLQEAPITLVLTKGRRVRVSVVSSDGKEIQGAAVALDYVGQAAAGYSFTGPDGRFEAVVPREARVGLARVLAPTHLLWSGCFDVPEAGPERPSLTLVLPPLPSATLRLSVIANDTAATPHTRRPLMLSRREGGLLTLSDVLMWQSLTHQPVGPTRTRSDGRSLEEWSVRHIAPGAYTLARSTRSWLDLAGVGCASSPPIDVVWTSVPPGTEGSLTYEPE